MVRASTAPYEEMVRASTAPYEEMVRESTASHGSLALLRERFLETLQ
jgi:hypothetical protein